VALFLDHEVSSDEVIRWADVAMYQAKEAGGNLIRYYEAE
jgi:GGDEF domain-containing protein